MFVGRGGDLRFRRDRLVLGLVLGAEHGGWRIRHDLRGRHDEVVLGILVPRDDAKWCMNGGRILGLGGNWFSLGDDGLGLGLDHDRLRLDLGLGLSSNGHDLGFRFKHGRRLSLGSNRLGLGFGLKHGLGLGSNRLGLWFNDLGLVRRPGGFHFGRHRRGLRARPRCGVGHEVRRRPLIDAAVHVAVADQHRVVNGNRRRGDRGCGEPLDQVIGAGDRRAASAAAGIIVPAIDARVLPAIDAEVERLVERVQLGGGEALLFRAHAIAHRIGEGVLAGQVVSQPTNESPGFAQGIQAGRRLELIARPAAFAKGLSEGVSQWWCGLSRSSAAVRAPKYSHEVPQTPTGQSYPAGGRSYPAC